MKSKEVQVTGIRTYFVYPTTKVDGKSTRVKGKRPLGCVAIHRDASGICSRGISICADGDNWVYATGRNKAIGMCRKAVMTLKTMYPIGRPVILGNGRETVMESAIWFLQEWSESFGGRVPDYKSQYKVTLTPYEIKILDFGKDSKQPEAGVEAPAPAEAAPEKE